MPYVVGIRFARIVLPTVNVGYEQDGAAGIANRLDRLAQLFTIPKITLLIEFNKCETVYIPRSRRCRGRYDCLGRRFSGVIRLIRRAAGEVESEHAEQPGADCSRDAESNNSSGFRSDSEYQISNPRSIVPIAAASARPE